MIANNQPLKQAVLRSGFNNQLRLLKKPSINKQTIEGNKLNTTGDDNALPPKEHQINFEKALWRQRRHIAGTLCATATATG